MNYINISFFLSCAQSEWKGETAGGCINHWTWRNNPQFMLTAKKDLIATVTLKQGDADNMPSAGFYVTKSNGTTLYDFSPFSHDFSRLF
jgi:hypothetical protein